MRPLSQFVWVSNQVAGATGKLTEWICARPAALPRSNPPPRGSAVAPPPTGGSGAITGEYVALSTVGDGVNNEKTGAPRAPTPPPTGLAKGLSFLKNDLRLRFAAIVVGLWVLNEICKLGRSSARLILINSSLSVSDPATE